MIKLKSLFVLMLFCSSAFSFDLDKSVLFDKGKTPRTDAQREASYVIYDTLKLNEIDVFQLNSTTNLGSGNIWFSFLENISFATVDIVSKKFLGNWLLTPWPNTVQMLGEGVSWQVRPYLTAESGRGYQAIEDPKIMALDSPTEYKLSPFIQTTGCLARQPLRFGDIDGNGSSELVLFLDNDLIVFSPSLKKIIFAMSFSENDEINADEVQNWFVGREGVTAQYIAQSGTDIRINARFPATRSFAKVFIDDFNSDAKKDIIVWRKLYESRLTSDSISGFKLEGELFVHYQLEDGEYQIQTSEPSVEGEFETDPAQQTQIKGWLESKNLTWQKGFPSKSECAGQEGQLIPEMHDVLLNDPDVLK